jgi:4-amino-4-deoxy-L-arabinose transferase-like glycosyltransferase
MMQSGNAILPLRNGEIVPSKPMMFHWLAAIPALITGEVGEWEIRLPSLAAGVGSVMVLFWLLNSTLGVGVALTGALILLTTEGFVAVSTEGRVDSVFSFFLVCALAVALRGVMLARHSKDGWVPSRYVLISAIACGCAVLTKGPVALIFVGMVVSGFLVLLQGLRGLRQLLRVELLAALAIPAPWYIAATVQGGDDFLARQFIYENLRRFTGGAGITEKPFWFYLKRIFVFCVPWATLLPFLLFSKMRALRSSGAPASNEDERILFRAGVVWFFLPILFLSLASGKHNAYLMPLLPGLAIMLAIWINSLNPIREVSRLLERGLLTAVWLILMAGPLVALVFPLLHSRLHGNAALMSEHFISAIAPRAGTVFVLYLLFALTAWWLVCTRSRRHGVVHQWGPVLLVLLFLVLGVYVRVGRAVKGWIHGDRPLAQEIIAKVGPEERINWVLPRGTDELLGVGRDDSFDTVFFYLNRRVVRLDTGGRWEEPGLYVARREWVEKQPENWRARIRMRLEGGKIDDKPGERVWVFDLLPAAPG